MAVKVSKSGTRGMGGCNGRVVIKCKVNTTFWPESGISSKVNTTFWPDPDKPSCKWRGRRNEM